MVILDFVKHMVDEHAAVGVMLQELWLRHRVCVLYSW